MNEEDGMHTAGRVRRNPPDDAVEGASARAGAADTDETARQRADQADMRECCYQRLPRRRRRGVPSSAPISPRVTCVATERATPDFSTLSNIPGSSFGARPRGCAGACGWVCWYWYCGGAAAASCAWRWYWYWPGCGAEGGAACGGCG